MGLLTLHLVEPGGTRHTFTARPGQSLMKAAVSAGIEGIAADCGGCMTCATCHVFVEPEWLARLPPRSAEEDGMLDFTAVPRRENSRLSCQIALDEGLEGLVAGLPETQY